MNLTGNHTLLPHPGIPLSTCHGYGTGYQFAPAHTLPRAADAYPHPGGLAPDAKPHLNTRIGRALAYFLRPGPHAMSPTKWQQFRSFRRDPLQPTHQTTLN